MTADRGRSVAPLSYYRATSVLHRLHAVGRWASCPMPSIAAQVPDSGSILDLGCGTGLFSLLLALGSPRRAVLGVDVDAGRIATAQQARTAAGSHLRVAFGVVAPGEVPPGPWDAIVIVDVLYLMAPELQEATIRTASTQLAAGGVLLVKEMALRPVWKYRWNLLQEWAAVRLLRVTQGQGVTVLDPAFRAGWMQACGLEVRELAADRGYPHPHHIQIGRAPS